MNHDLIPLSLLPVGEHAEIDSVSGTGTLTRRLHEMGIRQGVRIEMIRSGSPCIVRIDNCKLCFRQCDAFNVLVRAWSPLRLSASS